MNAMQFARILYSEVITMDMQITRESLESSSVENATDPYYRRLLRWYGALPAAERELLLEVMKQTAIDTVASTLGVLGGSAPTVGGFPDAPKVVVGGRDLAGDLQESWMELVQEKERD